MKIFGIEFKTRKELKKEIATLEANLWAATESLANLNEEFPFALGQTKSADRHPLLRLLPDARRI